MDFKPLRNYTKTAQERVSAKLVEENDLKDDDVKTAFDEMKFVPCAGQHYVVKSLTGIALVEKDFFEMNYM